MYAGRLLDDAGHRDHMSRFQSVFHKQLPGMRVYNVTYVPLVLPRMCVRVLTVTVVAPTAATMTSGLDHLVARPPTRGIASRLGLSTTMSPSPTFRLS